MKVDPKLIALAAGCGFDLSRAVRRAVAKAKEQALPLFQGRDDATALDDLGAASRPILRAALLAELNDHSPAAAPRYVRRAWKKTKVRLAAGLERLAADAADEHARILAADKATIATNAATFENAVSDAFA